VGCELSKEEEKEEEGGESQQENFLPPMMMSRARYCVTAPAMIRRKEMGCCKAHAAVDREVCISLGLWTRIGANH
jgi:hypothetical protein